MPLREFTFRNGDKVLINTDHIISVEKAMDHEGKTVSQIVTTAVYTHAYDNVRQHVVFCVRETLDEIRNPPARAPLSSVGEQYGE